MNTLVIEKQTGGYFKFTLNGDTANAITSIQNDLLAVGTQLHFKTGNGANIIKEQFIYPADVTIIASGTFTFTTVAQVWDKLIDIDYFAWLGGGGTGGVDRFDDLLDTFSYTGNAGKAVVVDGSELRLVPITLYNKRLFTELEDTPSSLVPNKMLVVNPAGTAVVLQDQPEQPEQLLNSVGYFDYNDLITQTTPLNAVANVALKLTNDTEGANTSTDQNPYGVSYVWDYTTNQFNFNELEVGDTIDVRVHVQVTTTSANQRVILSAKFGIGSVAEFTNIIYENQFKSAGLHEINFVAPFYMGSTYITDSPAELYLTTDSSATIKVDGWYVRILRKNINIITVDYTVPDATTTVKGIVRLAGDLAGTANSPTVPELANKVPNTRTVSTTSPLLGGGALSSNLTLSIQQANSVDSGYLSYVDWSTFNGKANDSAVVHLAGTETITGVKTFSADTIINGVTVGKGGASEVGNTAVGQNALSSNTSGILNTAIGFESLLNNTGGGDNTSLGWWSLKSNTTGNSNVSAGTASLANNTTGFGNTSLGWNSLAVSTTGAFNSALGYLAGSSFGGSDSNANTLTSYSIYIGYKAGPLANSQTNQIVIGKNAIGAGSNTVTIGNTDITTTRLRGEIQGGSFKKDGGTSSQFLKADGSVDSTTYQTALTNPVTGTGTTNYIPKFTGSSAIGNSLIYDNGTNVGIGTTSPITGNLVISPTTANGTVEGLSILFHPDGALSRERVKLWINDFNGQLDLKDSAEIKRVQITSLGNSYFNGGNVGIGTTSPLTISNYKIVTTNDVSGSGYAAQTNGVLSLYNYSNVNGSTISEQRALPLIFETNGSEKMRLTTNGELLIGRTSSYGAGWQLAVEGNIYAKNDLRIDANASFGGNVGIGTTSPTYKLQVNGTAAAASNAEVLRLYNTLDGGLKINFANAVTNELAYITANVESAGAGTDDGVLTFGTAVNGTASERMRIASNGNVAIGTTTTANGNLTVKGGATSFELATDSSKTQMLSFDRTASVYKDFQFRAKDFIFAPLDVEKMRITSNGEVLIGTTSSLLSSPERGVLEINGSTSSIMGLKVGNAVGSYLYSTSTSTELYSTYDLKFAVTGAERMRITSGGNVGIGTTSPAQKLDVFGTSRISNTTPTQEFYSTGNGDVWGSVYAQASGTGSGASLVFSTKRDGNTATDKMIITQLGSVGIGTTSPSYQLQLSTDSAAKPTSALWTIASDERIKENINSYTKGLNELLKINPITYDYNGLGGFKKGKGGVGIIAQEIAEILPDSVSSIKGKLNETDEEEIDILNFNGHELTYILINAVKEQNEVLKQLKAEIEILKNK